MHHYQSIRRKQRGISLVECLVTLVIVALGLLAAAQCIVYANITAKKANRVALASAMVERTMDRVRALSPAGYIADMTAKAEDDVSIVVVVNGTTTTITQPLPVSEELPRGAMKVTIKAYTDASYASMNGKVQHIVTEVTWSGQSTTEKIQVETLIGNHSAS